MALETETLCGAGPGERRAGRTNHRNGYRDRDWQTRDHCAHLNKVEIDFSRPGKPTDNAFIEALNARLRAECLNASWFLCPADAQIRIEEWRHHYNEERPDSALGNLTTRASANQAGQT